MIEHTKWPMIYESVYPGDEFGRFLGLLQDLYYDSMGSDELKEMLYAELMDNIDFEQLAEHWHNYKSHDGVDLPTYLGMTWDQYNKYMHDESYRPWHDADYNNQRFLDGPGLPLAEEPP